MSWLDAIERRAREAIGISDEPKPTLKIAATPEPKPEIKTVWFQIRAPLDGRDLGEVEAGYYSVADGVVTMHDEKGVATGTQPLAPDEDPHRAASRLARSAWDKARGLSNFNRRLDYPRGSFA